MIDFYGSVNYCEASCIMYIELRDIPFSFPLQNDALFQSSDDVARRIRCAWSDRFDKIISSRGFKVGSLSENTMDYSADAVSVWMDLRMGKDPFQGTPVSNGVVRLGSDMTVAIYMKSKIDRGLDVVIRDCVVSSFKAWKILHQYTLYNNTSKKSKYMVHDPAYSGPSAFEAYVYAGP